MKQPTKKQRIGLTVSAVWILLGLVYFLEGSDLPFPPGLFILFAILPVLIGWAIWWISRANQKPDQSKDS